MAEHFVNRDNAIRPGDDRYPDVIRSISQDGVCPFCPEHIDHYHGMPALVDGEHWLATENKYPYANAENHLIIIHRAHIETVEEISPDAWQELQVVVNGLVRLRDLRGGGFLMRFGDTRFTGATVSHLHAQIIAGNGEADGKVVTRVG